MNIGFFAYYLSGNGPRTRTKTIIRALGERTDHDVTVVTSRGESGLDRCVTVRDVLTKPALADPRTWLRVRRYLTDCDVVHVPVNCWQLLAVAATLDVPIVAGPGMQHSRPWLYRVVQPGHIIDTHNHISFWDDLGMDWTPIYPAVDRHLFAPYSDERRTKIRHVEGLSPDTMVALFVGRLRSFYGTELIRKLARNDDIHVVVCGTGEQRAEFEANETIDYRGFVRNSDLSYFYNLADVTVIPSVRESFSLVALESAACGTPVVTTTQKGCVMRRLFESRGTYIWCDRTSKEIAAETRALCSDDAYYSQQVEAGFDVFDDLDVSVEDVLPAYEDIYREAAGIELTRPSQHQRICVD